MANHGQTARLAGREEAEPSLADLMDPVALEARLVEARARRAAALARRKAGESPDAAARPPATEAANPRRPRLAASSGARPAAPEPEPELEIAAAAPRRISREGMLAAVFVAGLLGGFALVFLAPASLRQQIAHLIAPDSAAVPPAADAPVAGEAIASGVSLARDAGQPVFPARPAVVSDNDGIRPQSVPPAPATEAAPTGFADSAPAGIAVPELTPGLEFATTAGGARWIGPAPAAGDAARGAGPAAFAIAAAESAPAGPGAGLSAPVPSRAPQAPPAAQAPLRLEPVRLAAALAHVDPPQALPAAAARDSAPDPAAESAALVAAMVASAHVARAEAPFAVSATRGLPEFAQSGQLAPVSASPGRDDFAGGDTASIFADLAKDSDLVLAAYWPPGELIAAAPLRKAAPVAPRRTTNAQAADEATARQVTRIILQRRVERMLRDLQ
ncbi:MAG TPA: hypothetical protein PKA33_13920 [Amaricoccus sp.]|uniref:hypothetical protein n=1 Tax=Amaricoccus sp. TaxID=1872485 RepID=UPI002B676F72|nr:hypothetical protein [Amaricoccus sp.]HMQ93647.1 hypothetical protein [Amaricoccus sp.]HMR53494.1 hypothetical protein [Amaricoccus sp.]HMR60579.1 hypothetical protein [Amaricoccus sp.]HMU00448.1 hypothetical protein [Amaricoccus sp.]